MDDAGAKVKEPIFGRWRSQILFALVVVRTTGMPLITA